MLRNVHRIAPRGVITLPTPARTLHTTTQNFRPFLDTDKTSSSALSMHTPGIPTPSKKEVRAEGSIALVFATLSGGTFEDTLPDRFCSLKKSLIFSPSQAEHLKRT